jgi:hypothetical protein
MRSPKKQISSIGVANPHKPPTLVDVESIDALILLYVHLARAYDRSELQSKLNTIDANEGAIVFS